MSAKDEEERTPGFDIIGFLADVPDKIEVGDQEYKLYPLSLGKMKLMTKHEKAVNELIGLARSTGEVSDEETEAKLSTAIESAVEIFHIVTTPNNGQQPAELTEAEKESLRWKLSMANILQIMTFLRTATIPKEMLKNVRGPAAGAEKPTSGTGSQE